MIHTWIRLNLSQTCQIIWSNEPTLVTFCGSTAEISCGKKSTFISLSILMNMERERERETRNCRLQQQSSEIILRERNTASRQIACFALPILFQYHFCLNVHYITLFLLFVTHLSLLLSNTFVPLPNKT